MRKFVLLFVFVSLAVGEDWKSLLADADPAVRRKAAEALAKAGAANAVAELAECLIDDDPRVCAAAAQALGRAGKAARRALPQLRLLLERRSAALDALIAIARIGDLAFVAEFVKRDRKVLAKLPNDVLYALLDDHSWHIRYWILRLKRSPPPEWTERLATLAAEDPAGAVRLYALAALARDPTAVPHLRRHFSSEDPRMRATALAGVPKQLDAETARAVEKMLIDPVPQIRARAAYVLRGSPLAAPAIRPLLADKERDVRIVAASVLGHMGEWHEKGAAALLFAAARAWVEPPYRLGARRNLRAGSGRRILGAEKVYPDTRGMARDAVLRAKDKSVPHLANAYREVILVAHDKFWLRWTIVHLLGHIGEPAVPALRTILNKKIDAPAAACCLATLGHHDDEVLAVLVRCLRMDSETWPDWPATATGILVEVGTRARPLLEARLKKIAPRADADTYRESEEMSRIEAILKRIKAR